MSQYSVNLEDEDLIRLVESGDIVSYSFVDCDGWRGVPSQRTEITFPSGNKLIASSWSTPAPESSGLSVEAVVTNSESS